MADEADRADRQVYETVDTQVSAIMTLVKQARRELVPCNQCHWCTSPVAEGQLFCPDDSCAEDWAHHKQRRKDSGR